MEWPIEGSILEPAQRQCLMRLRCWSSRGQISDQYRVLKTWMTSGIQAWREKWLTSLLHLITHFKSISSMSRKHCTQWMDPPVKERGIFSPGNTENVPWPFWLFVPLIKDRELGASRSQCDWFHIWRSNWTVATTLCLEPMGFITLPCPIAIVSGKQQQLRTELLSTGIWWEWTFGESVSTARVLVGSRESWNEWCEKEVRLPD